MSINPRFIKFGRFWCWSISLLLASSLTLGEGKKPIVTTDLMKIKTMGQIDISPDGKRVVFVVTSMDKNEKGDHRYNHHLWMLDLENQTSPRQLTFGERSDSSPVWAPDSTRVAFVRAHKNQPQIWILSLEGGEAFPITSSEFGAFAPVWSPDGTKLLFSSAVPSWALEGGPTWDYERPGRSWRDVPNWRKMERDKKRGGKKTPDETGKDDRQKNHTQS